MPTLFLSVIAALGYYLRYKRAGVVAGVAVMVASWLEILVTAGIGAVYTTLLTMAFPPDAVLMWALAGISGAALRQWITSRQLPFESTILTVSDLDR